MKRIAMALAFGLMAFGAQAQVKIAYIDPLSGGGASVGEVGLKIFQFLAEEITGSVGSYVIGQACVALVNALVAFIAMSIAGVPFSVLLAFLVALLAFIPLVGGMIAGIMVSLVALTVDWQTAVLFAIIYFAYLQFEAYFVSPRIMQRAVAVPGAVAVIAVIAGGLLMGVLGALMAIPAAAAVMLLLKEVIISRQDQR